MKNIIKYFVLLVSLCFSSCEGDLNPTLYGTITSEDAFKTPQDLEAATTALYYELRQKGWGPYMFSDGSSFVMDEAVTDEWTTKWAWANFLNGTWTTEEIMAVGFYNWVAPNVTRCTYTIARIEECALGEDVKTEYISQIRALRAFFMFDLYRFYGPMPLIIEADRAINPDPDYKPERPSAASVEEFITTELRAAADLLPVEWPQYGRVTKGATLHYLLKYYMFKKEYQNALNIANEIIGLNYYRLEEKYADIFSAQHEGNRELIFVVRAEALADYGMHTYANTLPGDFASPHGNVIDGWNGHRMPWAFYDTFDEDDTRRELAVIEYTTRAGATTNLRQTGDIGALPLKYGIDPEASGIWAGNDKVLDRYAEVLLFKAEILNELNGPNNESVNLINDIRKRAFGAGVTFPSEIILSEEFNTEVNGEEVGAFTMKNYDAAYGAAWTYNIDNNSILSGENALHINVIKSNTDFWTLQVRADNQPVRSGHDYTIRFKVKASQNMNLDFRAEGPLAHTELIPLEANTIKNVSFDTAPAGSDGICVVFFALGNTGDNYDIWIDAFEFEAKKQVSAGTGNYLVKLSDFPSKESLRDWILKERGWEFWYEGKRREDLIRMGKYIEVGQQIGTNFDEKNLLFPIPSHVLIENPKITQNPRY
ncbi:MAG: RagB/SusD family nutrient uptake outer membrane protein [Prevotella sp.]|jgi:hypothetical protein|nr:RagB/SusD family nutrient uptake outer membrane protein [Prevotella sp.]